MSAPFSAHALVTILDSIRHIVMIDELRLVQLPTDIAIYSLVSFTTQTHWVRIAMAFAERICGISSILS